MRTCIYIYIHAYTRGTSTYIHIYITYMYSWSACSSVHICAYTHMRLRAERLLAIHIVLYWLGIVSVCDLLYSMCMCVVLSCIVLHCIVSYVLYCICIYKYMYCIGIVLYFYCIYLVLHFYLHVYWYCASCIVFPTYLPAYLPTRLLTYLTDLPYLSIYLPTYPA